MAVRVIVITGSMGSGKTTILSEATDVLSSRGIPHAAIDLDALGIVHLPSEVNGDDITWRNLACVWQNYASAGVRTLLLATVVEDRRELGRVREAVPGAQIIVCRLTAAVSTMQSRVRLRELGMFQEKFVNRTAALDAILDAAAIEDFAVLNEGRTPTEAAEEMLRRAGWLTSGMDG